MIDIYFVGIIMQRNTKLCISFIPIKIIRIIFIGYFKIRIQVHLTRGSRSIYP